LHRNVSGDSSELQALADVFDNGEDEKKAEAISGSLSSFIGISILEFEKNIPWSFVNKDVFKERRKDWIQEVKSAKNIHDVLKLLNELLGLMNDSSFKVHGAKRELEAMGLDVKVLVKDRKGQISLWDPLIVFLITFESKIEWSNHPGTKEKWDRDQPTWEKRLTDALTDASTLSEVYRVN
jgi:hypothetical protein